MKKSVWIPLLATACAMAGAVAGAYAVMMKREKEMAEYEQMLIRQDIPEAKWASDGEEKPETVDVALDPVETETSEETGDTDAAE